MDICDVILEHHAEQRRQFALLDDLRDAGPEALGAVWGRLADFLEAHAAGEEVHVYPKLLKVGEGGADAPTVEHEVDDAVGDHNNIREAVAKTRDLEPGSIDWWEAVTDARVANSTHMGEEERQDLSDLRINASLQERHDMAVKFVTYVAQHRDGAPDHDSTDPSDYIEAHGGDPDNV